MTKIPFIDIHTHNKQPAGEEVVAIENRFAADETEMEENHFYSVGLHPWHISDASLNSDIDKVRQAATIKNIVAIGETGLDRLTETSMELQREVFIRHLEIASDNKKPVIVHAVKSYPDIVQAFKKAGVEVQMIFHGFRGNRRIADQLIKHGFYLSFGRPVLQDQKVRDVFRKIPPELIFLETDESEISIDEIYKNATELKGVDMMAFKQQLVENFKTCFGDLI